MIVIKAVLYRLFATISMFAITYLITSDLSITSKLTIIDLLLKTFIYYIFEKLWNKYLKWKSNR